MSRTAKDYHYPLRLASEDAKAVAAVCRQTRVSFNRVVALCVKKALPEVRETLSHEKQRVTNVDPLPRRVLKRLYDQPDDDAEGIQLFMAAQAHNSEE